MMQDVLAATTVLSLVSVVTFVVVYGWRARHSWWRDPLGRVLMLGGLAVGSLSGVGTLRRVDQRTAAIDIADWLTVASAVAYLLVAAVWAYKTKTIIRETRGQHDRHEGAHRP